MEYEKHKIILPQFNSWEELIEGISQKVAIYLYQGGEWDKIKEKDNKLTLKNQLTFEQFMCEVRYSFPHGFRIGEKYLDKWGHKIEKDDK